MELAFATRALRSICEQADLASDKFGHEVAAELRARIADLRAAESVADIVAGQPRLLDDDDPRLILTLVDVVEMVIRPNHVLGWQGVRGPFEWQNVRRIRIDALDMRDGGELR
ncbi:MAG TPA: hypothetical protein DEV93_00600 [Chloroflexi bacterium]|jgi:hypothetical protein|nr:hypothetical protein [Chloroflexota bacterium]